MLALVANPRLLS